MGFELFSNLKLQTAGGCSEEKVSTFYMLHLMEGLLIHFHTCKTGSH